MAESNNPYDPNAISVWISGSQVGHLSREDAAELRPGLLALQQQFRGEVTLPGVVVGGGESRPSYGVFLNYSPEAFGLQRPNFRASQARSSTLYGGVRTGLSEAIGDDPSNDTYDLSWQERVPADRVGATTFLKQELVSETSPISRHFLYAALEHRLYELRDEQASALSEYDTTCESHHSEMPAIRAALIGEFGGVPLIEMYRQSAIRHQKAHNWQSALHWAEAGVQVYGTDPLRQEFVEDLLRRAADYRERMDPKAPTPPKKPAPPATENAADVLTCSNCGQIFERPRVRGRKPDRCPDCRTAMGINV